MFMVKHPRRSYTVTPLLSLEVATRENKPMNSALSFICKKVRAWRRNPPHTLHATRRTPHGASRLVQAISAWSVKPDVLRPGIVGLRVSTAIRLQPCMTMSIPPPAERVIIIPSYCYRECEESRLRRTFRACSICSIMLAAYSACSLCIYLWLYCCPLVCALCIICVCAHAGRLFRAGLLCSYVYEYWFAQNFRPHIYTSDWLVQA